MTTHKEIYFFPKSVKAALQLQELDELLYKPIETCNESNVGRCKRASLRVLAIARLKIQGETVFPYYLDSDRGRDGHMIDGTIAVQHGCIRERSEAGENISN